MDFKPQEMAGIIFLREKRLGNASRLSLD